MGHASLFGLLNVTLSPKLEGGLPSQRTSGQAAVTGVVPPPPRYVPLLLSRIGFSIPTARRFASNFANSRFRTFVAARRPR